MKVKKNLTFFTNIFLFFTVGTYLSFLPKTSASTNLNNRVSDNIWMYALQEKSTVIPTPPSKATTPVTIPSPTPPSKATTPVTIPSPTVLPFDPKSLQLKNGKLWLNTNKTVPLVGIKFVTKQGKNLALFQYSDLSSISFIYTIAEKPGKYPIPIDFALASSPNIKSQTIFEVEDTKQGRILKIEMNTILPNKPRVEKMTQEGSVKFVIGEIQE